MYALFSPQLIHTFSNSVGQFYAIICGNFHVIFHSVVQTDMKIEVGFVVISCIVLL